MKWGWPPQFSSPRLADVRLCLRPMRHDHCDLGAGRNDSTVQRLDDELRRPQGANSRRHGGRVELTSHVGQGAADIAPLSGPHGAAAAHPALCRQHVADPARRR